MLTLLTVDMYTTNAAFMADKLNAAKSYADIADF